MNSCSFQCGFLLPSIFRLVVITYSIMEGSFVANKVLTIHYRHFYNTKINFQIYHLSLQSPHSAITHLSHLQYISLDHHFIGKQLPRWCHYRFFLSRIYCCNFLHPFLTSTHKKLPEDKGRKDEADRGNV